MADYIDDIDRINVVERLIRREQVIRDQHNVRKCPLMFHYLRIKVITKLPNSEQSYKGKVKTHNYIKRQNQSTTGKL
jgi:hypothetical protein